MIKKIADWLFKKFCHPDYYLDIRGDLEEIHSQIRSQHNRLISDLIYSKEILLLLRISLIKPNVFAHKLLPIDMLKNYFLITVRQLKKNKTHSVINISGLTIGLTCCVLISLYILDELSYDRFHEKIDRIYRINSHSQIGGNERTWALAPSSVGPALKAHLPEIEIYTRIATLSKSQQLVTYGENNFDASINGGPYGRAFWADSSFFEIFTHRAVEGSLSQGWNSPNKVVITQSIAKKIFGDRSAVGEVLEFSSLGNYEILAVVEDVPINSHLQWDYLLSHEFTPLPPPQGLFWSRVYISVHSLTNMQAIESKIDSVARQAEISMLNNGVAMDYWTTPVSDIHLTSGLEYELYPTNDIRYIYIFSAISAFILLIATINFVNLSTAQLARRAKEVGIRKVMGAGRGQMITQFLVQSVTITFLSAIFSLLLVLLFINGFNQFTDKALSLSSLMTFESLSIGIGLTLLIGIAAGLYPALIMSAFNPVTAMKDNQRPQSSSQILRKILVAFQFGISVILISATFIIVQQLYFLKNQELGFDNEQILAINVDKNQTYQELITLKNQMLGLSSVEKATLSSGGPAGSTFVMVMIPEGFEAANAQRMDGIYGDYHFLNTYGLKLLAGRDFDPARPTDSLHFILNRSAVKKIGWTVEETIGKDLKFPSNTPAIAGQKPGKIIGVVDDFHYQSLHNEIGPLLIAIHSSNFPLLGLNQLSLGVRASNFQQVLSDVEKVWVETNPEKPLSYSFVDQHFEKQYKAEERLSQIISGFALLGIFIACLGLFGLALHITQQRTKEIGIRKVLGASIPDIVSKLSVGFVTLIIIGNAIAWPVTYIMLQDWLAGFAYHVDINPLVFVLAGISSVFIALLTIGYQTVKAAVANPVKSLRYE